MEEARIVEWRKSIGDEIIKGEVLFVIETEKIVFEMEALESGVLGKILAKKGDVLPVGGLVGYILSPGEKIADVSEIDSQKEEGGFPEAKLIKTPLAERPGEKEGMRISSVARKIAQKFNIDVNSVRGTGPGGRIIREDIERALKESKKPTVPRVQEKEESEDSRVIPLTPLRKMIAKRMTESFETPHFTSSMEVDAQELVKLREKLLPLIEAKVGIRLTFTDLLVKIVAKALEDNPSLNCSYSDGSVRLFSRIHIGVATAVEGGLIVPVIRDANKKTLAEICVMRSEIIQKTRDRKITPEEIRGSTFTITNMGMWGVDSINPIINPPEGAILSIGTTKEKPVVRDGRIVIRPMMILTVAVDHRVLDGGDAAKLLNSLKRYTENPSVVLL
jgi:pyruvate dehydrogenase E2 component (dihydrolipoamide acetyltransferase)